MAYRSGHPGGLAQAVRLTRLPVEPLVEWSLSPSLSLDWEVAPEEAALEDVAGVDVDELETALLPAW